MYLSYRTYWKTGMFKFWDYEMSCLGRLFFFFFWDRVSLYSPGCPRTHSVDQAGLQLRNLPISASQVLGLKVCATMPGYDDMIFKIQNSAYW
jgi:hypothetical protein